MAVVVLVAALTDAVATTATTGCHGYACDVGMAGQQVSEYHSVTAQQAYSCRQGETILSL